jgi:hypothetical protein
METLLPLMGCGLMILSLGYVCTFCFRAFFALDKLLQYEYENLPEQWEKDGQPSGMFWKPESKRTRGINRWFSVKGEFTKFKLLFTTPEWVKDHPEAAGHFKDHRRYSWYWNIGVPIWFILFLVIAFLFTPQ